MAHLQAEGAALVERNRSLLAAGRVPTLTNVPMSAVLGAVLTPAQLRKLFQ